MAKEERFDETDEGYYVQHGDVREWRWKKGEAPQEPKPVTTADAEAVVPPKKRTATKKATK